MFAYCHPRKMAPTADSFRTKSVLELKDGPLSYYSLKKLDARTERFPFSIKVLLEALLQGALGFFIGTGLAAVVLYGIGTVDLSSVVGDADVLGARLSGAIELAVLPEAVRGAAVVTVLTMIAGGVLPAVRASRLKPVEATRYV